jgi:hypothetical protein
MNKCQDYQVARQFFLPMMLDLYILLHLLVVHKLHTIRKKDSDHFFL